MGAPGLEECERWVRGIAGCFEYCYIVNDKKDGNQGRIIYIKSKSPTIPSALNIPLDEITNTEDVYLFIASKEVDVGSSDIESLHELLTNDKKLLVAGYRFQVNGGGDERLSEELDGYYKERGIAYVIPWNTCAMWNYSLFRKLVGTFDSRCDNKNPPKGMEEGLAIAKALQTDPAIRYRLLEKRLNWHVETAKVKGHRTKLTGKNSSLSEFLSRDGYLEKELRDAGIR